MLPRYWHLGQHKKPVVLQGMRHIGAVEHVEHVSALTLVVRLTQSVTGDWNLRQVRVALGSAGASSTPDERVPARGIGISLNTTRPVAEVVAGQAGAVIVALRLAKVARATFRVLRLQVVLTGPRSNLRWAVACPVSNVVTRFAPVAGHVSGGRSATHLSGAILSVVAGCQSVELIVETRHVPQIISFLQAAARDARHINNILTACRVTCNHVKKEVIALRRPCVPGLMLLHVVELHMTAQPPCCAGVEALGV